MEIKYKNTPIWKLAGFIWLLVSLMFLVSLILINTIIEPYLLIVFTLTPILSLVLSLNFFRLNTIDYIRLNDNTLSLHNGFIRPRKKVNITEIKGFSYSNNKLVLGLKNGRHYNIKRVEKEIKLLLDNVMFSTFLFPKFS